MTLEAVTPFRQVRYGDELAPVREWARQFEGNVYLFRGEVIDYECLTSTTHVIPHGLGRLPVGALLLTGLADLALGVGGRAHLFSLAAPTDETQILLRTDVTWAGGIRILVF